MNHSPDTVLGWMTDAIARTLEIPASAVAPDALFTEVGLSSVQAVELSEELSRRTGLALPPTLAYDHPTLRGAAAFIAAGGRDPEPRAPSRTAPADPAEPIAIVGVGCRVPGAQGPRDYWKSLVEGRDSVGEVPADRWDAEALYDPDPTVPGRMNTRWGGFLDGATAFDSDFFGLTASEAERMDPQQRLTLEVAWEALEDAGIGASSLSGSAAGVFMGVSTYDHGAALFTSGDDPRRHDGTGGALSVVANRLSYLLDVRGPSMVVDTACSSSLVAVHLACRSLSSGESELALAGGVNIISGPQIGMGFSRGGLMAADGRCKTFDHRADGYVRGEGVGVVVLKPLSRALADGDRVYAVVRGGAVNQDGRTNGLVAPNRLSQERVLRAAYASAGVDPAEVEFVEAHGTGTAVGDPVEVGALGAVLGAGRSPERPLRVGSVKSNVGHLEAAAGVTGLIKTALALHHRLLPPTIHFERANPLLGLERIPVHVQDEAHPLPEEAPVIAGVSSFGFGGTNAHLVVATAPAAPAAERDERPESAVPRAHVVPVSGRTAAALERRALRWAEEAERHLEDPGWLARAAAAAALRADHHPHRAAVVATDARALSNGMRALAAGRSHPDVCGPGIAGRTPRRPVMVFPGQGSQWDGMGRGAAAVIPEFRDAVRECDVEISRWLGRSLWSDEEGLVARGTAEVQPALFAMEVALARTWRAWGVDPVAVVGHSMGEIAAAHVSGALSLTDAARIVVRRSSLLTELSGAGGLALVEATAEEAEELIRGREDVLSVAALNGPRSTVLSGTPEALDEVVAELEGQGVFSRRVPVEFAAHSPQVEPVRARLREALNGISPGPADTVLYSTVTGAPEDGRALGPGYWERNVRATVRFAPAVERLLADGHDTFVEVSPHPVLIRAIDDVAAESEGTVTVSSAHRDAEGAAGMLRALGQLYAMGVEIDWAAHHGVHPGHVDLPAHGWDHRDFPLIRPGRGAGAPAAPAPRGLLGERLRVGAVPDLLLWRLPWDVSTLPELADHVVDGVPLVPGAYWLAAAAAAAAAGADHEGGPVLLDEVELVRPAPAEGPVDLQLALTPLEEGRSRLTITSSGARHAVVHVRGEVAVGGADPSAVFPLEQAGRDCADEVDVDGLYERLAGAGLRYGPRFRALTGLWTGDGRALGRVELPEGLPSDVGPVHPALLDSCLHVVAAVADHRGGLPLPSGARGVRVRPGAGALRRGWCHVRMLDPVGRALYAEVTVMDDEGTVVWSAERFEVTPTPVRHGVEEGRLYGLRWEEIEPVPAAAPGASWLLLADAGGLAQRLAEHLTDAGDRVTVLAPPHTAGDDPRVLAAMDTAPTGIVDLRALDAPTGDSEPARTILATADLLRSVAGRDWPEGPPRLCLVSSGSQSPTASPEHPGRGAGLWGLGRVAANEHPDLEVVLADLTAPVTSGALSAMTRALRSPGLPRQVAVAGGVRTPKLAPLPVTTGAGTALRGDRTYLVTGGLGALGLHTARRLAEHGARHLLLLGRGGPGPEAEKALAALGDGGVSVRTGRADVSDRDDLRRALDGLGTRFPALGGVFHLAGVLEDALVADLDGDLVSRAAAGKAVGAHHLHELTLDDPVEHFVLFSSMAGVLGSPGQGAYAAANAELDALAEHRAAAGLPAVSIAWGPWADAGLAVSSGGADRLAALGVPPLRPEIAGDLLEEALRAGVPHVVAAAFRWEDMALSSGLPVVGELTSGLRSRDGTATPRGGGRERVLSAGSGEEREREARAFLREQVAAIVGLAPEAVDEDVPFQEMGFDSMTAVELRNRLESALELRLSAALVFAHPTVADLAAGLVARLAPEDGPEPAAEAAGGPGDDVPGDDGSLADLDDDALAALVAEELDGRR
ncbi:Phthiocerol synthesis polyketide synthase type I PpsD [Nocardiopsis dassonvillei]|uniref:type I polyketide synthase n=1 Tax=Nocardiopsis dassonvillei TaxID=2014 RepID=UPI003F5685A4